MKRHENGLSLELVEDLVHNMTATSFRAGSLPERRICHHLGYQCQFTEAPLVLMR